MDMSTAADWYKASTQETQIALNIGDSVVSQEWSSVPDTMPFSILPM